MDENVQPNPSYPSKSRVREALAMLVALGGNVARCMTCGVSTGNHLALQNGPNSFNDRAFDAIDCVFGLYLHPCELTNGKTPSMRPGNTAFDSSSRSRTSTVRLLHFSVMVTPLRSAKNTTMAANTARFSSSLRGRPGLSSRADFLNWAGGGTGNGYNFYTHSGTRTMFKTYIRKLLEHRNQFTGLRLADDPTIMGARTIGSGYVWNCAPLTLPTAWETGNELGA